MPLSSKRRQEIKVLEEIERNRDRIKLDSIQMRLGNEAINESVRKQQTPVLDLLKEITTIKESKDADGNPVPAKNILKEMAQDNNDMKKVLGQVVQAMSDGKVSKEEFSALQKTLDETVLKDEEEAFKGTDLWSKWNSNGQIYFGKSDHGEELFLNKTPQTIEIIKQHEKDHNKYWQLKDKNRTYKEEQEFKGVMERMNTNLENLRDIAFDQTYREEESEFESFAPEDFSTPKKSKKTTTSASFYKPEKLYWTNMETGEPVTEGTVFETEDVHLKIGDVVIKRVEDEVEVWMDAHNHLVDQYYEVLDNYKTTHNPDLKNDLEDIEESIKTAIEQIKDEGQFKDRSFASKDPADMTADELFTISNETKERIEKLEEELRDMKDALDVDISNDELSEEIVKSEKQLYETQNTKAELDQLLQNKIDSEHKNVDVTDLIKRRSISSGAFKRATNDATQEKHQQIMNTIDNQLAKMTDPYVKEYLRLVKQSEEEELTEDVEKDIQTRLKQSRNIIKNRHKNRFFTPESTPTKGFSFDNRTSKGLSGGCMSKKKGLWCQCGGKLISPDGNYSMNIDQLRQGVVNIVDKSGRSTYQELIDQNSSSDLMSLLGLPKINRIKNIGHNATESYKHITTSLKQPKTNTNRTKLMLGDRVPSTFFYTNKNDLVERLNLLISSRNAGNDSANLTGMIRQVLDAMIKHKVINQQQFNKLFQLYGTNPKHVKLGRPKKK